MKKARTTSHRSAGGEKILAGLRELHEAIVGGDRSKLTVHTVEIPDPAEYSPRQVKAIRESLGVSQRIFAQLLAVSPELVAHWEYGIRKPAPIACRLLDKIKENLTSRHSCVAKVHEGPGRIRKLTNLMSTTRQLLHLFS